LTCPRLVDLFSRVYHSARDEFEALLAERGIILSLSLKPPIPPTPRFREALAAVERLLGEGRVAEAVELLAEISRRARLARRAWAVSYTLLSILALLASSLLGVYPLLLSATLIGGFAGFFTVWAPRWCLGDFGGEEVGYPAAGGQGELQS